MRHPEIKDGEFYALVRQGYDRDSLKRARKVRILDRTKRYTPRRWYGRGEPKFIEHEPDSHGAKGAEHMLAEMVGEWSRDHGEARANGRRKFAVKPAELFMAWDDFLAEVEKREQQRRERDELLAERREAHTLAWNTMAERLSEFLPESIIELIRENAQRDPTRNWVENRIRLDLGHLQEMAEVLERSKKTVSQD